MIDWHPIEGSLPPYEQRVLLCVVAGPKGPVSPQVHVGLRSRTDHQGEWFQMLDILFQPEHTYDVTHWAALPGVPEGVQQ